MREPSPKSQPSPVPSAAAEMIHCDFRLDLQCRLTIPAQIPFGARFPPRVVYSSLPASQREKQSLLNFHPHKVTIPITENHLISITPTALNNERQPVLTYCLPGRACYILSEPRWATTLKAPASEPSDSNCIRAMRVHIPQILQACTQDAQTDLINVSHRFHLEV